ncbi:MAG: membrane protein of unknown function [Promethearchaeota archaeon]|nr:MAG: membrane protein of unknown function [Candidatus Lokiarchaeota archaeon]
MNFKNLSKIGAALGIIGSSSILFVILFFNLIRLISGFNFFAITYQFVFYFNIILNVIVSILGIFLSYRSIKQEYFHKKYGIFLLILGISLYAFFLVWRFVIYAFQGVFFLTLIYFSSSILIINWFMHTSFYIPYIYVEPILIIIGAILIIIAKKKSIEP